jgi:hypothetical protein
MDLEIKTESFISFLTRLNLKKLVNDAIIFCDNNQIFSPTSTKNKNFYCENYEPVAKVYDSGSIKVANLEKLISIMNRFESDIVRIAARENKFIVTDGKNVGNSSVKITQVDEEFLDSYSILIGVDPLFDKKSLVYSTIEYKDGFEITIGALQTVLKDAKAFGYEIYVFTEKDGILNCTVKTKMDIPDSFNRKIPTVAKIGKPIQQAILSLGFREIVDAISKDQSDDKTIIKFYFGNNVTLITDNNKFFYNLHNVTL